MCGVLRFLGCLVDLADHPVEVGQDLVVHFGHAGLSVAVGHVDQGERAAPLLAQLGQKFRLAVTPKPLPQPVLAPLTPAAIFLVATIRDGHETTVHDALPDLSGLVRAIGFRDPAKRLTLVTSISSDA
jgi:hypothetical protein